MDFIFNELSFRDVSQDHHASRSRMNELLQVCKQGRELGMAKLAVREDFYSQSLSPGYTILNWLNDQSVSPILRNLLLAITRYPYIDGKDEEIIDRFVSSYTFLADEEDTAAEGLAVAYLYNTVAVSLLSSETWSSNQITLKFSGDGYENQIVKVNHASQGGHVEGHKTWLIAREGVKLSVTDLKFDKKQITLSGDHHGNDVLLKFSRKLVRSQYVTTVINSLPYNRYEINFIRRCYEDGKIEIVLVRSDEGLGIVIQTTGKNLLETQEISRILEAEFSGQY
jgi:hypothetical protein